MIDFYTVGLIPLDRLSVKETGERDYFLSGFFKRNGICDNQEQQANSSLFDKLCDRYFRRLGVLRPYSGTMSQQGTVSDLIFNLHNDLRVGTTLSADTDPDSSEPRLKWKKNHEYKEGMITLLKGLTWEYVISSSQLAGQQVGYRRVVEELFDVFANIAHGPEAGRRVLPVRYREMLGFLDEQYGYLISSDARTRAAADMVAGLTDVEALNLYQRLTGQRPGSAFLPPIN